MNWSQAKEKFGVWAAGLLVSLIVFQVERTNQAIEKNTEAVATMAVAVAAQKAVDAEQTTRIDKNEERLEKHYVRLNEVEHKNSSQDVDIARLKTRARLQF